jgi:hypothetical protein
MADPMHTPPEVLTQSDLPVLPLVELNRARNLYSTKDGQLLDLIGVRVLGAGFGDVGAVYYAVYRKTWTAQSLEAALKLLRGAVVPENQYLPLVILPYLDEDKLAALADQKISGLDLCGNALLIMPGRLLVYRSGRPNRYRVDQGLKSPYTGKASLVSRALLERPRFATAKALLGFIEARGSTLSQPLVSRTLRALEDDLMASQAKEQGIAVLQPEKLLDRLVSGWQTNLGNPAQRESRLLWRGTVNLPAAELLPVLATKARAAGQRFSATGLMSATHWTNLSSGDGQAAYADVLGDLLNDLDATATRRFPNLELWRTPDDAVYFNATTGQDGSVWASRLQTYLELVTGDARTQQAAQPLRQLLLAHIESELAKPTGEGAQG